MNNSTSGKLTWHCQAIDQLSDCFNQDPQALAFVLFGSLAGDDQSVDAWSDIDVVVVLADAAVDRYFYFTGWLSPLGRLVGLERHENHPRKTLRVCLEEFQRFDLSFVAESALRSQTFCPPYKVLWSKLPDLEAHLAPHPKPKAYQAITENEIGPMVDSFWYKASAAIVKVARNDLLIGLHLAQDLVRDCLVLQMIRRDQERQTNIHRTGGWGNEVVARFHYPGQDESGEEVLNLIRLSCEVYDSLAQQILPEYSPRSTLLYASLEAAKQECRARMNIKE